jgi:catalase
LDTILLIEGAHSRMFDSLYIPDGSHVRELKETGRVIHWIREVFGHCKPIGATGEAVSLVHYTVGVEGLVLSNESHCEVVDSYE